jgi:hypothetical protein
MADRRSYRDMLAIVVLALCTSGATSERHGPSRMLDSICRAGGCEATGGARITSGPTPDSYGLEFPSAGSVSLRVDAAGGDLVSFALDVLVAGDGSLSIEACRAGVCADSKTIKAVGEYTWAVVYTSTGTDRQPVIPDALNIHWVGGGNVQLADVRTAVTYRPGCSTINLGFGL